MAEGFAVGDPVRILDTPTMTGMPATVSFDFEDGDYLVTLHDPEDGDSHGLWFPGDHLERR